MMPASALDKAAAILTQGRRFLILTHREPDGDAVGSMLALGQALRQTGRKAVMWLAEPPHVPFTRLDGAETITSVDDQDGRFDAVWVLDCGRATRIGAAPGWLKEFKPLVNVDHHASNECFGDVNLVDAQASSTGELIYRLLRHAALKIDRGMAENLFAALQTDTGAFRYGNTTAASFRMAAELVELGVDPWDMSQRLLGGYGVPRLQLLALVLESLEMHHEGQVGMLTLTRRMFERTGAHRLDSEGFVEVARFLAGVELAVLIRQTGPHAFKFSLRSNGRLDVAQLARRFGGGGHARAAGFECEGALGRVKRAFLEETHRFLNAPPA